MVCCLVFSGFFAVFGQLWSLLSRTRAQEAALFAPVARWPAPAPARARPPDPPARHPRLARMLQVSCVGIAAYVLAVTALTWTGAVVDDGPWWGWVVRTVLFAGLAAASLATARQFGRGRRLVLVGRERVGLTLVALGITWFELSAIDMHVLGLYELATASVATDLFFHGSGAVLALVGWRAIPVRTPTPTRSVPTAAS